jgi:hypothetical protein
LPYFIRRPYAETSALRQPESPADEVDLLDLAKNVLSVETGRAVEGQFRLRGRLQPGDSGTMVLELALDEGTTSVTISLTASDLAGPGLPIPAESVQICPSTLTLFAGASAEVTVTVLAPPDARPGLYAGILSATGDETFAIGIQAEVH